ncbi:arrestin-C-like [Schistocerca americana]|uniref:arrestin-C-like n=1 Tax=Schistocerca americana TaxID=7009 RepID=UPI001F4F1E0F|nr:arrestin-C-like [Schistocerca americana]
MECDLFQALKSPNSAFHQGFYSQTERPEEQLHRRNTVRMGIRVVQRVAEASLPSEPPAGDAFKPFFLLSEGRVELRAALDRAAYCHGDEVRVHVAVTNDSSRTVRRIKVSLLLSCVPRLLLLPITLHLRVNLVLSSTSSLENTASSQCCVAEQVAATQRHSDSAIASEVEIRPHAEGQHWAMTGLAERGHTG